MVAKAQIKKTVAKKAPIEKAVAKKAPIKKAVAKKSSVAANSLSKLQQQLDANKPAEHWSKELKRRFRFCSMPEWVTKQESLAIAWKNCERTDWMMTVLWALVNERNKDYTYVLSADNREQLRNEIYEMSREFGAKWRSRAHSGNRPSSINSTHRSAHYTKQPWTYEEKMQMTDFIRDRFPTPEFQLRQKTVAKKTVAKKAVAKKAVAKKAPIKKAVAKKAVAKKAVAKKAPIKKAVVKKK